MLQCVTIDRLALSDAFFAFAEDAGDMSEAVKEKAEDYRQLLGCPDGLNADDLAADYFERL